MSEAWIGIVGVMVGALAALGGDWLAAGRSARGEHRAERLDAYLEFLTAANRGIRVREDLDRVERGVAAAKETVEQAQRDGDPDMSVVEDEARAMTVWQRELGELRQELSAFLLDMDRGLAKIQLVAPLRILNSGKLLRNGINDRELQSLPRAYATFAALAHSDLEWSRAGVLKRYTSSLYMNRIPSEAPAAIDRQQDG